ncbi:MAG: hypothetical protein M3Z22_04685 [Verrucomicrobiota bacterium]|nr:hypothetical protein [Verrucomicrobiota bacterium]
MTTAFVLLVLGALAALLFSVRALQVRRVVSSEMARKLVHVAMGFIGFPLPWFFANAGPVWLLAAAAVVALAVVRFIPAATCRLGAVLGGTGRVSLGEFYYPLGVAVAFTLAGGNRAAYCAAVGVLAFADTAGALVGKRWGSHRFKLRGGTKSCEGSGAVLATSPVWVAAMLVFVGGASLNVALSRGLLVAAAAAAVEAVSSHGLDNLFLPIVVVELTRLG